MGSFGNLVGESAAGFLDDLMATSYFDRARTAVETVAALRPHLPALGITRVSRQTGLDHIGIPCWASFRPNARSLSGNQGKGLTDAAACASAIMEAAEFAIAEQPEAMPLAASASTLSSRGYNWLDPTRLLPFGSVFDREATLHWLEGRTLAGSAPYWVPIDTVDMDGAGAELTGICKTSNGLASGNTSEEAIFHAICELVERDATSLWSLLPAQRKGHTALSAPSFDDPIIDQLCDTIEHAGLTMRLFDQTSDLGIPVVMALLGPGEPGAATHFSITAGYGAHPIAARAAIRAITEAAQSRIGSIAGSRDDIDPLSYAKAAADEHLALLTAEAGAPAPAGLPLGTPLSISLDFVKAALSLAGIDPVVVPLGGAQYGISVVKVLAPDLEDREPNLNWRPGARAIGVMLQL